MSPTIPPRSLILVTGASGFLGAWIIHTLLKKNYRVRAAVRSPTIAEELAAIFKDHPNDIEFTCVNDIVRPGAFDAAVKGVDAVVHTAAPLPDSAADSSPDSRRPPSWPAAEGTLRLLASCHTFGTSIKRVVITSFVGTVQEPKVEPHVYTEAEWNETVPDLVEISGPRAPNFLKFVASKILQEQHAWEFIQSREVQFDVVTLLPSFLLGPALYKRPVGFGGSNHLLLDGFSNPRTGDETFGCFNFIDVRDAADNHIEALIRPSAGGNRILLPGHRVCWQEIYDAYHSLEQPIGSFKVPPVDLSACPPPIHQVEYSTEKSERILGTQYNPLATTVRDALQFAVDQGWN